MEERDLNECDLIRLSVWTEAVVKVFCIIFYITDFLLGSYITCKNCMCNHTPKLKYEVKSGS